MYANIFKKVIDFSFALLLTIIFLPLFIIISILIKLDSEGKVLFVQQRSGKDEKPFNMYKFRTMHRNNDVRDFKKENEVTKIGEFLRKTSLDELPQLINILKGEMSFVGPRPWIEDYRMFFNKNQKRRLEVLPGLTGLAQVSGRNDISIKEKIDLDNEYKKDRCKNILELLEYSSSDRKNKKKPSWWNGHHRTVEHL